MRFTFRWKTSGAAVLAATTLAVGLAGYAVPAGAAPAAGNASPAVGTASTAARSASRTASGGVSAEAAVGTPQLNKTGTNQEVIRQLVQCGTTMYAVGRFTQINQLGVVKDRNNVFSFSATAPYTITGWAPNVNGQVNAIAFNGSDCSHAYIGGKFTSINGTPVSNIAEIDATATSQGNVVSGFGTNADNEVWTMVYAKGHLLTGGDFIHINGTKENHFASLNPGTGADDGFIHLNISGTYTFCVEPAGKPCTDPNNRTQVYNQQLSHSGNLDLVEGRFTSVGGLPRQQIFMLNLATSPASVTGWTSAEWDGSNPTAYPYFECWPSLAFYVRSAAWSPDDNTVYLATTGFHPAQTNTNPRQGLCDSVSAWPAAQRLVTHNWIEYSGCDSYYTVAADNASVYAAGHPRWANNPNACNTAGTGAFPDPGLQGLDPATGIAQPNSGGTALYTMTRANADNMLITGAGLWIGSTNRYTVNKCGDLTGPPGHNSADHAGICFLPYP